MEQSNVTQIIIDTINTILGNLFSSIDNNLYEILDDIIFINPDTWEYIPLKIDFLIAA